MSGYSKQDSDYETSDREISDYENSDYETSDRENSDYETSDFENYDSDYPITAKWDSEYCLDENLDDYLVNKINNEQILREEYGNMIENQTAFLQCYKYKKSTYRFFKSLYLSDIRKLVVDSGIIEHIPRRDFIHYLEFNKKLEILKLSYCKIDDKFISILSIALKGNSNLIKLYLNDNNITSKGIELLSHSIYNNKTLKKLNLSSNNLDSNSGLSLTLILRSTNLEYLDISGNPINDGINRILNSLENNINLKVLKIGGIIDKKFKNLHTFKKPNNTLKVLSSASNYITDSILNLLLTCFTNLKLLDIEGNNITDKGINIILSYIKNYNKLQLLNVDCNYRITHPEKLVECENLRTLFIGNFNIEKFIQTEIEYISVSSSADEEKLVDFISILLRNENLKNFTSLNGKIKNSSDLIKLCKILSTNKTLRTIKIDVENLTDDDINICIEQLHVNYTLIDADFSIKNEKLQNILKRNKKIRTDNMNLLVISRKDNESYFYENYFPLDIFKIIFDLCFYIPKYPF